LSNVDVICLDKTGTLTTNHLNLHQVCAVGINEAECRTLLGDYAASTIGGNRTNEAIEAVCPGRPRTALNRVPFSSAYKWSALAFKGATNAPGQSGIYALGAPEILNNHMTITAELAGQIDAATEQGLRAILFGYNSDVDTPLFDKNEQPVLPLLTPLGVVTFTDELRNSARETLDAFAEAEVEVKIISGDNPQTVAALARQVGLGPDIQVVSGLELEKMDALQFNQIAQEATIFGRITPDQKARLVQSMRSQDHYVAMMGDGVNDVLSLKQANVSVAMESGSQIARNVADMVLRNDSFEALPFTFIEGQRIRNAVLDQLKLFMVRIFGAILLILSIGLVTGTFPLLIKHNSVVVLLTVGLPTTALAFWAKPGQLPPRSMVRSILHFVLPATLLLTLVGLFVYLGYLLLTFLILYLYNVENVVNEAALLEMPRSALVTIWVLCGIELLPFLKPPTPAWTGGEPLSGDKRLSYLAITMLVMYFVIMAVPQFREFFNLAVMNLFDYVILSVLAVGWGFLLRYVWRAKLLDRFLDTDLS